MSRATTSATAGRHLGPQRLKRQRRSSWCFRIFSMALPSGTAAAREQEVERAPEAVEVGPVIDRAGVLRLLGGHVVGRADHRPASRQVVPPGRHSSKPIERISPMSRIFTTAGSVACGRCRSPATTMLDGLDVAVDEPRLVRVVKPQGGLADVLARLREFERPVLLDQPRQIDAVHELHRQVVPPVDLAGVEDLDDVGVLEREGRLDLALVSLADDRIGEQDRPDDLERHEAAHRPSPRPIDLPHPPLADLVDEEVRTEMEFRGLAVEDLAELIEASATRAG